MKSQQGFIVFGGIAWLYAAVMAGGMIAVVEHVYKDQDKVATHEQGSPTLLVASAAAVPTQAESSATQQQTSAGTRYRNGGYFGDQNSDVSLEQDKR